MSKDTIYYIIDIKDSATIISKKNAQNEVKNADSKR